jgi:hypothetical protein
LTRGKHQVSNCIFSVNLKLKLFLNTSRVITKNMYIPTNIYKFIVYKWTHKMLSFFLSPLFFIFLTLPVVIAYQRIKSLLNGQNNDIHKYCLSSYFSFLYLFADNWSIFSKTLWKHKTKQKKIAIRCCYLLTRQLFT